MGSQTDPFVAGYFLTKIFHPNISPAGDICVNTLKRDWSPDLGISHVLQVIRCLLIVPFPESSLNDDAGKLFMESYEEYVRRAKLMTSIHAMSSSASEETADAPSASSASVDAESRPCADITGIVSVQKKRAKPVKSSHDSKKKKGLKRL